jgi:hypothetical protein
VEELEIGFENHISSLLQTAFPNEIIHNCWKFKDYVVGSIKSHGYLLRPHTTRSLKERHHLFHTSTGYIGSSRDGIQAGDMIGVIQGCPSPVLLRMEGARCIHLGTCYVLGLMNGEAATRVKDGSLDIVEVDLV